jgi:DNA relaxase NicK
LDWLSGTFPVSTLVDDALAFLGAAFQHNGQFFGAAWTPLERGANGYRSGVANGHIKVYFDGSEKMGVHFEMSGKGVKQFLSCSNIQGAESLQNWLECAVNAHGIVFSRCDWACDDRSLDEPLLDLDVISQAVDERTVVSRFKSFEERRKKQLGKRNRPGPRPMKDDSLIGHIFYFGSMMSELCVCFYDKAKEQIVKAKKRRDKEAERSLEGVRWVRCELRAKKGRAHALVLSIIDLGLKAVLGVLRDYLDFRQVEVSEANVTRWVTVGWWDTFLKECTRLPMPVVKPERTIEAVRQWLLNQAAPMFYAVCEVSSVQAFVHHMLEKGKSGVNARRDLLIASERALACLTP